MSNYRFLNLHLIWRLFILLIIQLAIVENTTAQEVFVSITHSCNNAELNLSSTGLSAPITYTVTDPSGAITNGITGIHTISSDGTYMIQACGSNGKSNIISETITIERVVIVINTSTISETCDADNGSINVNSVTINNGTIIRLDLIDVTTGSVISTIDPTASSPPYVFSPLPAGMYRVEATDDCPNANVQRLPVTVSGGISTIMLSLQNNYDPCEPLKLFSDPAVTRCGIEVAFSVSAPSGGTLAYPLCVEYEVISPTGTITDIKTTEFSNFFQNTIPFYNDQQYTYNIKITDACGTVITNMMPYVINEKFEVRGSSVDIGCGQQRLSLFSCFGRSPVIYTILDPNGNTVSIEDALLVEGDYKVTGEDDCGFVSETVCINYTQGTIGSIVLSEEKSPGCDIGFGSARIRLSPPDNSTITSLTINSGPGISSPLVIANPFNSTWVYTGSLLAGTYSITVLDECGRPPLTTSLEIPAYSGITGDFNITYGECNFSVTHNYTDNAVRAHSMSPSFRIEYLATGSTNWVNQTNNAPANFPRTYSNEGMYRIVRRFRIWDSPTTVCEEILGSWEIEGFPSIVDVVSFPCGNGTFDIYVDAITTNPMFSLNDSNGNVVSPPHPRPLFTDLMPGPYLLTLTDDCGDRQITITVPDNIIEPVINLNNICFGFDGFLDVPGYDFLDYEWFNVSDPTNILSTNSELTFPDFSAMDEGTYGVNLSLTGSCFTTRLTVEVMSTLTPNAGTGIPTELCIADGTFDLFDYLQPGFDQGGVWTDATGTVANVVNFSDVVVGTFIYTYTVINGCGQSDFTDVALTFAEQELTCEAHPTLTISLNAEGEATITPQMIDNGSTSTCLPFMLATDQTDFDCSTDSPVTVTLTVSTAEDSESCTTQVTIQDISPPVCTVSNLEIKLRPLQCDTLIVPPEGSDNCDVLGLPTSAYLDPSFDGIFGIGTHNTQYTLTDASDNVATCDLNLVVNAFEVTSLKCIDHINLSLDPTTCSTELTPEMLLSGTDYGCLKDCEIEIRNEHNHLIDNFFDESTVGRTFTYEICCGDLCCWGSVLIEYKLAPTINCLGPMDLTCGALDMLPLPEIDEVDGCIPATFTVVLLNEERVRLDCHATYTHNVKRTYGVQNANGTVVSTCTREFNLLRLQLGAIEFPGITKVNCSDLASFIPGNNGMPLPWINSGLTGSGTAGVPVVCSSVIPTYTGLICPSTGSGTGIPLIPQQGAVELTPDGLEVIFGDVIGDCSAAIRYSDSDVIDIGCTRKITRSWEIYEWWCGAEYPAKGFQVIELFDDEPPSLSCPPDFTVTTNDDCASSVIVPPAIVEDGCGNGENVTLEYPLGILESNGGEIELAVGENVLTYKASDDCYNTSTPCTVTVTVKDDTEPVAICEQNTVVSISGDGNTIASSHVFDDGSWDECGEVTSCAAKMEDVIYFLGLDTDLEVAGVKYVRKDLMDRGCEQEYDGGIEVGGIEYVSEEDLCVPYVRFCCSDVGIDQVVIFTAIDKGGNRSDCMVNVEVQDETIPSLDCPAPMVIDCRVEIVDYDAQFGTPIIDDNCNITQTLKETPIPEINQCGIGKITRLFEIIVDGDVVRSCEQVISIMDAVPFDENNIDWPLDYETSCATPATVVPTYGALDDACSLLGHAYEDENVVDPISGKCIIRRHWTVIDWCNQVDGEFVTYPLNGVPYVQIITITNTVPPMLLSQPDRVFGATNEDCSRGDVKIERFASDDCTLPDELGWVYIISGVDGFTETGSGSELVGNYLAGTYSIEWRVSDECNNMTVSTQQMEVLNTTAPIAVCNSGETFDLDETSGTVIVMPSDLNGGSFHPCVNAMNFSLEANGSPSGQVFDCNSLAEQQMTLYAIDTESGLSTSCITMITILDPDGACDEGIVTVSGEVYTEHYEEVEDVKVELGLNMPFEMTDDQGAYAFGGMPMGGSYKLLPGKNDNHLNGVSTLDLIKLQRHILQIETFDSPYKMIAADVNNNKEINGLDLVELRKLILGVYLEFPENSSWRFIDAGYSFEDETQPWLRNLEESYEIINLSEDMAIDFIGVKIGDVNGDAVTSSLNAKTEDRSGRWPLVLELEEFVIAEGDIVQIPVYFKNYERVNGWQTTFQINPAEVEILGIESTTSDLGEKNIYLAKQNEGWITMSYHNSEVEYKSEEEALFTITVRAKQQVVSSEILSLSSKVTHSEAYRGNNEIVDLELSTRASEKTIITSVNPNPWIDSAAIDFYLPKAGQATWTFYDVSGRLIYSKQEQYKQGSHTMEIAKQELNSGGVIYMKLTTDEGVAEYKMIVIE